MGWWSAVREAVGGRGPTTSSPADRARVHVEPSVSSAPPRSAPGRRKEHAWRQLPPVQRTLAGPIEPAAPLDVFTSSLSSHQNPSFLAPLTHGVTSEMTGGLVNGLADLAPVSPRPYAAAGELAVPASHSTPSSRKRPVAQRLATWDPAPPPSSDVAPVPQAAAPPPAGTAPLPPSLSPSPGKVSVPLAGAADPAQPEQPLPHSDSGSAERMPVDVPVQRTWPVVARQSPRRPAWPDLPTRELVVSRWEIPAPPPDSSRPALSDPPPSGALSTAKAPPIHAVSTVQTMPDGRRDTPRVPFELSGRPEASVGMPSIDKPSVGEEASVAASASTPLPELSVATAPRSPDPSPSIPGLAPPTPDPVSVGSHSNTSSLQRSVSLPNLHTALPAHRPPTRVPAQTIGLLGSRAPRIHLQRLSSATPLPAAPQPVSFGVDGRTERTWFVARPAAVQRASASPKSSPPVPSPSDSHPARGAWPIPPQPPRPIHDASQPGDELGWEYHSIDARTVGEVALDSPKSSGAAVQRSTFTPAATAMALRPPAAVSTTDGTARGGARSDPEGGAGPVPNISGVHHRVQKLVHPPVQRLEVVAPARRTGDPSADSASPAGRPAEIVAPTDAPMPTAMPNAVAAQVVRPTEAATPPLPIVQRGHPAGRSQQSAPSQPGMSFASMFSAADPAPRADGFTTVQLQWDSGPTESERAAADSGQLSDLRSSTTPVAQRQDDDATTPPPMPDPLPMPPPAAPAADQQAGADIDEMARRLFEPLSARLRAELWLDRERVGLVTDARP